MSKSSKILLLAVSVVLVLTLFLGANSSRVSAASGPQDGAYRQMQVYSEVLRHIQTDYVEDPNMNSVTSGALRGLLESLDSNSSYLSPAEYKEYKSHDSGRAQVGINISKRFGFATVVSVIPGSAADRANINDGDVIESIDDKNTRDLSLATIELLLDGQPGTSLNLAVIHPPKATPRESGTCPRQGRRTRSICSFNSTLSIARRSARFSMATGTLLQTAASSPYPPSIAHPALQQTSSHPLRRHC